MKFSRPIYLSDSKHNALNLTTRTHLFFHFKTDPFGKKNQFIKKHDFEFQSLSFNVPITCFHTRNLRKKIQEKVGAFIFWVCTSNSISSLTRVMYVNVCTIDT